MDSHTVAFILGFICGEAFMVLILWLNSLRSKS